MQNPLDKKTARGGLCMLAFVGLAVFATVDAASAQQAHSNQARDYYGFYQDGQDVGGLSSRQDRAEFDRSGTRGRMGLGASPYHPEGPGNVSD